MMWKKMVLLIGILIVIAILAVPAVSAQNVVYFVPQQGIILGGPSNNITVQVRANLSADSPINAWQTEISFDSSCINITDVAFPDTAIGWSYPLEKYHVGRIEIGNVRLNCGDASSDILLANLTIHCEAWGCTSPLNFTGIVNAARFIGCTETLQMYNATWINGTVTIETEEQHDEEPHAPDDGGPSGSRGAGGGAVIPSPSPTPTPTATPIPTETPVETPTLAPSITSPSTTPTPTPTTPLSVPRIPLWLLILIVIAIIVIAGIIIMVMRR